MGEPVETIESQTPAGSPEPVEPIESQTPTGTPEPAETIETSDKMKLHNYSVRSMGLVFRSSDEHSDNTDQASELSKFSEAETVEAQTPTVIPEATETLANLSKLLENLEESDADQAEVKSEDEDWILFLKSEEEADQSEDTPLHVQTSTPAPDAKVDARAWLARDAERHKEKLRASLWSDSESEAAEAEEESAEAVEVEEESEDESSSTLADSEDDAEQAESEDDAEQAESEDESSSTLADSEESCESDEDSESEEAASADAKTRTGKEELRFGKTLQQLETGWVGIGNSHNCRPLSQRNPKRCRFQVKQKVSRKVGRRR